MPIGRQIFPPSAARKSSAVLSGNEVVDEVYKLRPCEFTLRKLFALCSDALPVVGKFLIVQKMRESVATPFDDIVIGVHKRLQREKPAEEVPRMPSPSEPCLDNHIAFCLETHDSLSSNALYHLAQILNNLKNTVDSHECSSRVLVQSSGCGSWTDLVDLLAPVVEKPLLISALLPAMEWLIQHPDGIVMAGFHSSSKSEVWSRRWEKWSKVVDECWAIRRYLDPSFVFLEEAEDVQFSEVVKSTNEHYAHYSPRLPEPSPIEVAARYGNAPARLRRFASLPEATSVASALRSHLAIPGAPGGGSGPSARICTFSCYNMIWW